MAQWHTQTRGVWGGPSSALYKLARLRVILGSERDRYRDREGKKRKTRAWSVYGMWGHLCLSASEYPAQMDSPKTE